MQNLSLTLPGDGVVEKENRLESEHWVKVADFNSILDPLHYLGLLQNTKPRLDLQHCQVWPKPHPTTQKQTALTKLNDLIRKLRFQQAKKWAQDHTMEL